MPFKLLIFFGMLWVPGKHPNCKGFSRLCYVLLGSKQVFSADHRETVCTDGAGIAASKENPCGQHLVCLGTGTWLRSRLQLFTQPL